jgi:hypothetical protein
VLTSPSSCTRFNECVYSTPQRCEFGFGTHGLQPEGKSGLLPNDNCGRSVLYGTR